MIHITKEWNISYKNDNFDLYEYFKIIIELKRYYPIEKIFSPHLINDSIRIISRDLVYMVRENPKEAYEYFILIKELMNYPHKKESLRPKYENIFEETINRLSKDVEMIIRGNPTSFLFYLEIVLMSGVKYDSNDKSDILEILVDSLKKIEYGRRVVQKAVLLLMRYKADPVLIGRLLENHPKTLRVYMESPEIARDIFEAMTELSYESYN